MESDGLLYAAAVLLASVVSFSVLLRYRRRPPLPPGPRGWPIVGCLPLLRATPPHVAMAQLARRYGPIVYLKLGSYGMIIASKPGAVRSFLKTMDRKFANRPPTAGATHVAYAGKDIAFGDPGPHWALLRKLSTLHMLGPKSLKDWAGLRESEIGCMVRDVYGSGSVVQVPETVLCAVANVIGRRSLSQRVFASRAESSEFKEMMMEIMRITGSFNVGDFIPPIAWLDLQGVEGEMKRQHRKFDKLLTEMLEQHAATAGDRAENPDLIDMVSANAESSDGIRLTETNIKALLLNMFVAGTETTETTVEWAMAELLKNPTIIDRAHEEMDRVVGRGRRIREADLPDLPYLRAICKEAFRMHPAVPLSIPRVSTEACEVDGYHVPANTRLLVNLWAIGREAAVWTEPEVFSPERFMSGGEADGIEPWGNDFELTPFGAGRRICVGMRMGAVMVEHLVGALLQGFDWELPEGVAEVDMAEKFGLVLQKAAPLRAVARPRLPSSAYEV